MQAIVSGDGLPVVTCRLSKGETIISENGGMSWMDPQVKMATTTNGGIMKGLGRALSGESLFMNTFTAEADDVEVAFASSFPGKILELDLKPGESIIAQKRAFLCGESSINMQMHFRKKIGAGLFGGEGFIMQKITGPGKVFLEIDGDLVKKELAAGQKLVIDNGYLAAMSETVSLDIETVKGLKNMMFGGEGLFVTTLTGPGTIWLQSMPVSNLIGLIASGLPSK